MVKNRHLLLGIAGTSLVTALICLLVLARESGNGSKLSGLADQTEKQGSKLSGLADQSEKQGNTLSIQGNKLSSLEGELQETRRNLQSLNNEKVSGLSSQMKKSTGELNKLQSELPQLEKRQTLQSNKLAQLEQGLDDLKKENKRLIDSANKKIAELEERLKKMSKPDATPP